MCDKIDENKKKWIIGGSILGVIIVVIIVVVVLTVDGDDDDNKNKGGSNIGDGDNNNDTNTTIDINDRTNVLFIIIDDLGWGDIPRHGGLFSMENLDSLFDEGIEFTNYYVHPVCTPTRAAFLTGKYAWKLGLHSVQTMAPGVDERIPLDTPTVAEVFTSDELDYSTYYVGKWHIGYAKWAYTPVGRGFDEGFGILQSHGNYYNHTNSLGDYPELTGYDMFDLTNHQPYWPGDGIYSADLYIDKAKEYIYQHKIGQEKQDKPFYMYLSWQTIHEPMQDPNTTFEECEGLSEYEEVTVYCNKLKYFDILLGRLIQFLKDNDLYDNTLIAVTTDNGGMPQYETTFISDFFFHSSYGCNYPYRGGKITLFEGGVKGVGLMAGNIIREMGLAGTQSNILLHAVDWYNTLLEGIAGVESIEDFISDNMPEFDDERSFDGINIFDYINNDISDNNVPRNYIYPNIEKENPLVNTTNETLSDLVNKLYDGGITLNLDMNQTYEEYIQSLNDLKSNLDVVIWWDDNSSTMWKYIRGTHLYWNSYHCNQTYYNYDDLLYIYNAEWLFNLTDNPREYEELNYLNPLFDFSSINNIDKETVNNITLHLRDMIDYQVSDNGYLQEQEGTRWYCKSIPQCNNGTWAPFLEDDGTYINDNCDHFCTAVDYLQGWGVETEEELLSRYWD